MEGTKSHEVDRRRAIGKNGNFLDVLICSHHYTSCMFMLCLVAEMCKKESPHKTKEQQQLC